MFLLDRRTFLSITGAAAALPRSVHGAARNSEVYTADATGASVDSVVILGDEAAVLVDTQFNVAHATQLADMIAMTGRRLETIYVTHMHPDHLLGLDVILQKFPDARPVTHPLIHPVIEQVAAPMLTEMASHAPAGTFADRAVVPEPLETDHIMLEGERIEVLEPMHGDTALVSALHVPALDTLIASDFVYADCHAWTAENTTAEDVDKWLASLDTLQSIGAGTVIPGHRLESSANDESAIEQTRAYLKRWQTALEESQSKEELEAAMSEGADGLGLGMALTRGAAAAYPQ